MIEQFTPGPWSFAHRETKAGMFSTEVFCGAGHTIASLAWYPKPTVDGVTGTYREANARLIAAAPDLLEAVQLLVYSADAESYQIGRAAIAKATA